MKQMFNGAWHLHSGIDAAAFASILDDVRLYFWNKSGIEAFVRDSQAAVDRDLGWKMETKNTRPLQSL